MRAAVSLSLAFFALAACGERADAPASTAAEKGSASVTAPAAKAAAPVALTAADLRRVCRAGLAAIHGQTIDAIRIDGAQAGTVDASWRAPVDGGRSRGQCRVDGDRVVWKPVDRPTPDQNRWMDQAGDPAIRFTLDGDAVAINTTLPDGTTATATYSVAAEQEAR